MEHCATLAWQKHKRWWALGCRGEDETTLYQVYYLEEDRDPKEN